jgi:hypothetical protein
MSTPKHTRPADAPVEKIHSSKDAAGVMPVPQAPSPFALGAASAPAPTPEPEGPTISFSNAWARAGRQVVGVPSIPVVKKVVVIAHRREMIEELSLPEFEEWLAANPPVKGERRSSQQGYTSPENKG